MNAAQVGGITTGAFGQSEKETPQLPGRGGEPETGFLYRNVLATLSYPWL